MLKLLNNEQNLIEQNAKVIEHLLEILKQTQIKTASLSKIYQKTQIKTASSSLCLNHGNFSCLAADKEKIKTLVLQICPRIEPCVLKI